MVTHSLDPARPGWNSNFDLLLSNVVSFHIQRVWSHKKIISRAQMWLVHFEWEKGSRLRGKWAHRKIPIPSRPNPFADINHQLRSRIFKGIWIYSNLGRLSLFLRTRTRIAYVIFMMKVQQKWRKKKDFCKQLVVVARSCKYAFSLELLLEWMNRWIGGWMDEKLEWAHLTHVS